MLKSSLTVTKGGEVLNLFFKLKMGVYIENQY